MTWSSARTAPHRGREGRDGRSPVRCGGERKEEKLTHITVTKTQKGARRTARLRSARGKPDMSAHEDGGAPHVGHNVLGRSASCGPKARQSSRPCSARRHAPAAASATERLLVWKHRRRRGTRSRAAGTSGGRTGRVSRTGTRLIRQAPTARSTSTTGDRRNVRRPAPGDGIVNGMAIRPDARLVAPATKTRQVPYGRSQAATTRPWHRPQQGHVNAGVSVTHAALPSAGKGRHRPPWAVDK